MIIKRDVHTVNSYYVDLAIEALETNRVNFIYNEDLQTIIINLDLTAAYAIDQLWQVVAGGMVLDLTWQDLVDLELKSFMYL